MQKQNKQIIKCSEWLFSIVLLLLPLIKCALGVDITDSMYSAGNFVSFPRMEGTWVIATFFSNVIGYFFTCLPGGENYLILKIYTNLVVSAMALITFFWLKRKMPSWIVFWGEIIAICLCWAPTTILYNYLTYFFMLLAIICIYEGLTGEKPFYLTLAGICLGINLFVRFPNVLEIGFIFAVWMWGLWKQKRIGEVVKDTLWCMLGYFGAVILLMVVVLCRYGVSSYIDMITSLFTMTDSETSYKPTSMLYMVIMEYKKGMKLPVFTMVYACIMSFIFRFGKEQFLKVKKVFTIIGIVVLFYIYYLNGYYTFNYFSQDSIIKWAVSFLNIGIVIGVFVFLWPTQKDITFDDRLLYVLLILVAAITPVGSNTHIHTIVNNLFYCAPLTIYGIYKMSQYFKSKIFCFPIIASLYGILIIVTIQSLGFCSVYSYRGSNENVVTRNVRIENNLVLQGMYTDSQRVDAIEELSEYWYQNSEKQKVVLWGSVPGVAYFLNAETAISTSWPDLGSYKYDEFEKEMTELQRDIHNGSIQKPMLIFNAEGNIFEGSLPKEKLLKDFVEQNHYKQVMKNAYFIVYN